MQLSRMPGMLAGSGCPVGMAQPLLELGRLLVAVDRPFMGGQLSALGRPRPLTRADRVLLALLGAGRGLVTVVFVHGRLRSFEQVGLWLLDTEHGKIGRASELQS